MNRVLRGSSAEESQVFGVRNSGNSWRGRFWRLQGREIQGFPSALRGIGFSRLAARELVEASGAGGSGLQWRRIIGSQGIAAAPRLGARLSSVT